MKETNDIQKSKIIPLFRTLWNDLHISRKKQVVLFCIIAVAASFAEILSLSAVIPLISVLASPEYVAKISLIQSLERIFNINDNAGLIKMIVIIFIVSALISGVVRLLALWMGNRIAFAIGSDISRDIYRKILLQPYQVQISKNSSESISSITTHVNTVVSYVLQPLALLLISFIVILGIILTLILVNPVVAFFSAVIFGLSYFMIILSTKGTLHKNSIIVASNQSRVVKALQEGLGAVRDVLINNLQTVYTDMYQKADQPMRKAQSLNLFIAGSPRFIMETIGLVVLASIAYFFSSSKGGSGSLVLLGTIAFGAQRLLPVLQQAYGAWAGIRSSIGSLENVIENLQLPIDEHYQSNSENIQPLPLNKYIVFDNVIYRYSNGMPDVLKGLSFTINKGERVGIVGDTGSGKSTVLDILMGLLKPISGLVVIDDTPLNDNNIRNWQKNISQVPQSIFLTDASIAENIAFGLSLNELDLDRVKTVATKAHVADFIESKTNGYYENIGERGVALSGGQRQRIAIARALYKNASVLILDEATSALDNITEKAVIDSIKELGRDITIIMIAHRLSTIENCDKIIELSQGKVNAIGTYTELLAKSDSFKKLVNSSKESGPEAILSVF